MSRKIVIGDIHGSLRALLQLLERVKLRKTDELIFMGDYVDGWSESAQTLDFLLGLAQVNHCIFIKGNHDAWCEEWLKGEEADEEWVKHGGQETIDSYRDYNEKQKENHLRFFETMPYFVTDRKNHLFVHAGFSSMHGPEGEHYDSNFFWDRTLWELALATDNNLDKNSRFFPRRLQLFREIFIGHTPTTNYYVDVPMKAQNVWNVDTGAAFKGRLTAMDVETKQYWQSESVWQLYPNEKGRNK